MRKSQNIVLIGMPGCGKTTVGVLLAKATAKDFVDTDILIQVQEQSQLQDIIDRKGYMELRNIEESVLINFNMTNFVVATGGSAVYSEAGMNKLAENGVVIYLDVSASELSRRLSNYDTRGIARRKDQTFDDLCAERLPLYKKYANHTITCHGKTADEICTDISKILSPE